ncbi:CerR family C-terminal domain-containing protein [Desulfogranum japonicum]|uniref:CerR family C-terminal domain-containing protein n=1 Tax=Desulfogranum japonicum TaxID=231447 RepID=UPI00040F1A9C|nr:CerR family C-terminal domain-containing protein [Desulfogranum japonicum]
MGAKKTNGFADALQENSALMESPEGLAELIRMVVFRTFHDYFRPERKQWERKILVREVVNPSSAMPRISEQLFMPDILATRAVFKRIKPSATDEEADIWMDLLHAQIFFYSAAEDTFCLLQGKEYIDQELYQHAARAVAKAMILLVQLPLPRDLRGD